MKSLESMAIYIKSSLNITDSDLATNLGITVDTLHNWGCLMEYESHGRSRSLKMLYAVVKYLKSAGMEDVYSFLCNARIKVGEPGEYTEDDDGTVTVIGYINSYSNDTNWMEKIDSAKE